VDEEVWHVIFALLHVCIRVLIVKCIVERICVEFSVSVNFSFGLFL
jgi:hypothetical protein